jgi:predicted AlkP superfamily phosphohydrolase/phosphomutase
VIRNSPLIVVLIATVLILEYGCGRSHRGKVIVLGFDGMDYGVARALMAQGRMPNFARLASAGSLSPLATVAPPQSPVAWSSFITGMDAGSHGIFDFVHRDPHTMTPYLSTTRIEPAQRTLRIGTWRLPLSGARATLLRDGEPFWDVLEQHGVRTTIIRMPANFPPSGTATRELGGMGTPDILGTSGTFTLFSSAPGPLGSRTLSGGRVFTVDVVDNMVQAELVGPDNPFRTRAQKASMPFIVYLDPSEAVAKIEIGDEERVLKEGEWSDWVRLRFGLTPLNSLHAICRFYLKRVRPSFELYVSPLNLDPMRPAMPISSPASYAGDLAKAAGLFYTQGIAEDANGLNEHVLTRDEFLEQAAFVRQGITRQYWSTLAQFKDGLLFYYFGSLDQVSHMMWRARDPGHPAYDRTADEPYASVIDDLYVTFDQIVGETIRRMGSETTLIVMSDHGFTSWRRSFHLNGWLRDHGYLNVIDPGLQDDPGLFQNVDWSRTRAYGFGLNSLYINLRGRERDGIVAERDRAALVDEIRTALVETIDPKTGRAAVANAYPRERIYLDAGHFDIAPDLMVGYAGGTRVSNASALGGVPTGILEDNTAEWSGDHCMDPDAVPGILLTSRLLKRPAASLGQLAATILAEFGIEKFPSSH